MAGLQRLTGNCPAIQVVLPAPYIERLNALAQERGVTRSALIRAAIDTAYVGAGVHAEWDYLRDRVYVCYALLPDGSIVDGLTLEVVDPDDWQRYAVVHATPSGERWAPVPGAEVP